MAAVTMVVVTTTEAMTAPMMVPTKVEVRRLVASLGNPVSRASLDNPVKASAAVVVVVARETRSSSPKTVRPSAR
jgi:hypothetical protein